MEQEADGLVVLASSIDVSDLVIDSKELKG